MADATVLSFQITRAGKTIQIDCDREGIATLIGALAKLVGERASHTHFLTPRAGGNHLSEKTPWGEEAVPEVLINYAEGD